MNITIQVVILSLAAIIVTVWWPHYIGILFCLHIGILMVCLGAMFRDSGKWLAGYKAAARERDWQRGWTYMAGKLLEQPDHILDLEMEHDARVVGGLPDAFDEGAEAAIKKFKEEMARP